MKPTGRTAEIKPLTGIRGVAALWIVLFHFKGAFTELLPGYASLDPILGRGNIGVDLFFILSGFILAYVYKLSRSAPTWRGYGRFIWLRFARIYPNHLATLLILAAMLGVAHLAGKSVAGEYTWQGFLVQLALLQAWPGVDSGQWNYPAWSISGEWFAYVFVFPLAWWVMRFPISRLQAVVLIQLPLLIWVAISWNAVFVPFHDVLRVSLEFYAGCYLFLLHQERGSIATFCERYCTLVGLALVLAMVFIPLRLTQVPYLALLVFPWLILGLGAETSALARGLSLPFMLWLGDISYALYMSHAVVQKLLRLALPTGHFVSHSVWVRGGVFALYWVVLIAAAAALYYLVEVPSRDFLRRCFPRLAGIWTRLTGANPPASDASRTLAASKATASRRV